MKYPKKLLVPLFLCFSLIVVWAAQGVPAKNTHVVTIEIKVVNGEIQCVPDPAYARYGEKVKWESDYVFTVDFGKKKPLKKQVIKAQVKAGKKKYQSDETEGEVTTQEAKLKQKKVTFKYSVEVQYDEGTILKTDPDLEIIP